MMDFGSINIHTVISKILKGVNTIGDLFVGCFVPKTCPKTTGFGSRIYLSVNMSPTRR